MILAGAEFETGYNPHKEISLGACSYTFFFIFGPKPIFSYVISSLASPDKNQFIRMIHEKRRQSYLFGCMIPQNCSTKFALLYILTICTIEVKKKSH